MGKCGESSGGTRRSPARPASPPVPAQAARATTPGARRRPAAGRDRFATKGRRARTASDFPSSR